MYRPIPFLIRASAALLLASISPAIAETSRVYISDKINPPFASGNSDVQIAEMTPDGSHALYLQSTNSEQTRSTLFSVPVAGGTPVALLDGVNHFPAIESTEFQATPDSQDVIALQYDVSGSSVYSIPISGGTPKFLGITNKPLARRYTPTSGGFGADYHISPDGSRVIFANFDDGLLSATVAGNPAVAINQSIPFVDAVGFSLDSQTVYFVGSTGSGNAFYSVPADASAEPTLLYATVDNPSTPIAGQTADILPDRSAIISTTGSGRNLQSIEKFEFGSDGPVTIATFPTSNDIDYYLSDDRNHAFVVVAGNNIFQHTLHLIDLVEETQVTLNTLRIIDRPILSPDGNHVIYTGAGRVWSQPVNGTAATDLAPDLRSVSRAIGFNADGSRAVFTGLVEGGNFFEVFSNTLAADDFQLLNLPLSGSQRIAGLVRISIDGDHVFYSGDYVTEIDDYLYRVPIAGGESELMHKIGVPGGDVDALVQNPDGSGFAMIADLNDNAVDELFYRRYDQSEESVISTRGSGDGRLSQFAVTADSRFVVYRAQQFTPGIDELVAVPTTGGPARRLNRIPTLRGDVRPYFKLSPNGKYAVFTGDLDTNTVTELYAASIEGGSEVKLHPDLSEASGGEVFNFQISPDSRHVVFEADLEEDEKYDVYLAAIDGSFFRKITPDFVIGDAGGAVFSPDGQVVVFSSPDPDDGNDTGFFIHDIATAESSRHPTTLAPAQVQFSPDGNSIAFTTGAVPRMLHLTTLAGGTEFHLGSTRGSSKAFTRDSRQLIHIDSDGAIYVTETATGDSRLLYTTIDPIQQFQLSTSTDHVLLQTRSETETKFISIPIDGSDPKILLTDTSELFKFVPLKTVAATDEVLFSVGEALWSSGLAAHSEPERVNLGYDLIGEYLLIPGTATGFFIGRPEGSDQLPALYFFDPEIDEGAIVQPVLPIPKQGEGVHISPSFLQSTLVLSQDRRQLFYTSDMESPDIRELYAATGGTRVTRFTSNNDDALESAGATDAIAPEALFTVGNFTGLRFDQLPSENSAPLYSANVTFTASADLTDVTRELLIGIQDDADAPPFETTATPGISTRQLATGIETGWTITDWTAGQTYTTPDLSQHFDYLFAIPEWEEYNPAVLTIGSGSDSDPVSPHRAWFSEGNIEAAPRLELIFRSDFSFGELERLSFGEWAAQNGLGETPADSDLDGDGLTLAVEYAFRLDPNSPDPFPAPRVDLRQVTTDGFMQIYIEFERDPRRTSASIALEVSNDLQTWHPVTTSTLGAQTDNANEYTTLEGNRNVFVALAPIPPGSEVEDTFVRFRVSIP